ncbi:tripartite tricarboxylate transporter substrate-binding protein [Variovorax sp. PAMC26660]|uniref:tripartite tricarboxylate transporter substrate-binding protein n=1 Tax=Variovorax sp. PAMC26660 TaxID=2762322 RepID=UPI00164D9915|nr:tripartite tricarboxylate transporter substrate-binding protein [Variovorax sp. PAMC26660]QNK71341.1 tripartite tricarboxylate transporter substrate binding protein [Variovorax sp. PAMC26660]
MKHTLNFLRKLASAFATVLVLGLPCGAVNAGNADAPTRIIIGFAPGGALDALTRLLAERLRTSLGEIILVENKPGASGRMALEAVKRAPPDGKTILITASSPIVMYPLTYKRLPYDPDKDLAPVANLADVPMVVSTSPDQPYKTMPEYVAWVKRHPESPGVGLVALGGGTHFGTLSLAKSINVPLTPAAYRGGAPMLSDVMGGMLPIGIDAVATQFGLYKAGKLRYLGVLGSKRTALLPDIPTLKEAGVPGFDAVTNWYAAFVPAGTPSATVGRLEKAMIEAVMEPGFRAKLAELGMESSGRPASEVRKLIQAERAQWKPIVEASGFTADE